jgi:hypothetical protein
MKFVKQHCDMRTKHEAEEVDERREIIHLLAEYLEQQISQGRVARVFES